MFNNNVDKVVYPFIINKLHKNRFFYKNLIFTENGRMPCNARLLHYYIIRGVNVSGSDVCHRCRYWLWVKPSGLFLGEPHGVDENVDTSGYTYYIKELYLFVVIAGIGVDDACEQMCDGEFLEVVHPFHDVNGHHAVERTPHIEGVLTDAVLHTDGVEHVALGGVHHPIDVNHLDEEADKRGFLRLVEMYLFHIIALLVQRVAGSRS